MQRHCLTLNLRPDPALTEEYVELHRLGRPEVNQSIRNAGVLSMQIYLLDTRLFMIMDVTNDFSFERKGALESANPNVQAWEELVSRFQDVSSASDSTKRWRPMEKIFGLRQISV